MQTSHKLKPRSSGSYLPAIQGLTTNVTTGSVALPDGSAVLAGADASAGAGAGAAVDLFGPNTVTASNATTMYCSLPAISTLQQLQ